MHNYKEVHTRFFLCVCLLAGSAAEAQTPNQPLDAPTGASVVLPAVTVTSPRALEAEPTDAASEQRISGETLNTRPIERPGEMLEAVPGLIVTQHSGEGKANQYFLRGIESRPRHRSRDLARWHADQHADARPRPGLRGRQFPDPRARREHAHPQGPLLTGPRRATSPRRGRCTWPMPTGWRPTSSPLTGGSFGYWRGLAAGSMNVGAGTLTGAGEIVRYDGALAGARRHPQVQRLPALQRRHRGQRLRGDRARLHELLAFDRPDPAACRARRIAEPLRRRRPDRRRRRPALFAVGALVAGRTRNPPARSKATSSTRRSTSTTISPTSSTIPPTATSSSRPTSARSWV